MKKNIETIIYKKQDLTAKIINSQLNDFEQCKNESVNILINICTILENDSRFKDTVPKIIEFIEKLTNKTWKQLKNNKNIC